MKKISTLAYIVATAFFVVNAVSACLNLNPLYPGTAFFYCVMITTYAAIWVVNKAGKIIFKRQESGQVAVDFERKAPFPKAPIIAVAAVWAIYGIVTVGSMVFFNVPAYRDQMPDYRVGDFSSEIQVLDSDQIPIVDQSMATKIAEKKLGEKTGQLKLRYVYDLFIKRFKFMSKLITFEQFSALVDEALEIMRHMIQTNIAVANYIGGNNNE